MKTTTRRTRSTFPAWAACLAAVLAAALPSAAAVADDAGGGTPRDIIALDEIERGQKGYGYSVFAGSEPQRFELEVLGVARNTTPELSYIFARLSGHDLERSGVVAGMSGSPVYIDDRLAGAVAFSYSFQIDAIAGITPIGAMRRLRQLEPGSEPQAASPVAAGGTSATVRPATAITWRDLVERTFPEDLLGRELRTMSLPRQSGGRSALQWSAAGFGEPATALLREAVGELAPWGGALLSGGMGNGIAAFDGAPLTPGSAVALVLIRGDLNLAGSGTVTDVRGDEILAFGHPLFGLGPVSLPMARSEVISVIASRFNSFKLSNTGELIGTFDQDREAGVRGRMGPVPAMIPLDVRLRGLARRDYHMEVADLPLLSPTLIAISALGSLSAGSYTVGAQGLDLEARFQLADYDDLVIRQAFDGDQVSLESILYLLGFGAFLEGNGLREVDLEAVEVEFTQTDRPRRATLIAAHAAATEVKPGEAVTLNVELQAYRGERYRREIETTVPDNAPEGRYMILVGDGTTMDAARLAVERRTPETFEQVLRLLQSFHPRDELHIVGLYTDPGLAVAGETLPQLPGSVRTVFAGGGTPAGEPLYFGIAHDQVVPQDRPVAGLLRVDLDVRRR